MTKYLLFAGSHYYPSGGWQDCYGEYETLEDAQLTTKTLNTRSFDWFHIVDVSTLTVIESGSI